eukprot:TRINITY_DN20223_c0_g1_i1.p1 TRINITY_DN20223_c0_g1~~TRINITY_DN20223_c0_g1_i1.p1  ORF type:complete len:390 (-),score=36.77 TRINITY_DN20223_c0_g1_i1:148-1317(-)
MISQNISIAGKCRTDQAVLRRISSIHLISISSTSFRSVPKLISALGVTNTKWLVADLKKAESQRHIRPWIIVYGHRPMYCSNSPADDGWFLDCHAFAPGFRKVIEPLFQKYSVDLYMCGHMHDSELIYPVSDGKVVTPSFINPRSTAYMISGYAGCREGFNGFSPEFAPPWSAWRQAEEYGYGILSVHNASHLHFEWIYAARSEVGHDVWVVQDDHQWNRNPSNVGLGANFDWNVVKKERNLTWGDAKDFALGFGVGMGLELGSIPDCVADYYPLNYTFSTAMMKLEEGLRKMDYGEVGVGLKWMAVGVYDLFALLDGCGAITGVTEFLASAILIHECGLACFAAAEIEKVAANREELLEDLHMGVHFYQMQLFLPAGLYFGNIFAAFL